MDYVQSNVLIIDDDIELCQLLKKVLDRERFTTDVIHKGKDGLKQVLQKCYHLIVLDIMLPEMNGFEILTELRKTNSVPVLMLTAKDSELDKVSGLRLGADEACGSCSIAFFCSASIDKYTIYFEPS